MVIGILMLLMAATPPAAGAPAATVGPAAASEPMGHDRKGRPTMPVRINGRGPFDMVIDTAAQVSLVAPDLAAELQLPKMDSEMVVNGATEATASALYGVDRLSNRLIDVNAIAVPGLPNPAVTNARGIIGMDLFVGRKLTFDCEAATVGVGPSGPPAPGFVAVDGQGDDGGFLTVPVSLNGRTVSALVDSGAEGTIASAALLDLLGWAADDPRLKDYGTMRGAGGASRAVKYATIDSFRIGPVRLSNVPVIFSGGGKPGIILGSDLLNLLTAYAVDPKRGELQIRMPAPAARPAG